MTETIPEVTDEAVLVLLRWMEAYAMQSFEVSDFSLEDFAAGEKAHARLAAYEFLAAIRNPMEGKEPPA